MSKSQRQHSTRPKYGRGIWVELTMVDGQVIDGVLETTDLRQLDPSKSITLRFGVERQTYTRETYKAMRALAVLGNGKLVGRGDGGRKEKAK